MFELKVLVPVKLSQFQDMGNESERYREAANCLTRCCGTALKPVTDEQVFYDKFLCEKFYLLSARVYMQQILYNKFS